MYIYASINVYIHIYIYMCIHVCLYVYIDTLYKHIQPCVYIYIDLKTADSGRCPFSEHVWPRYWHANALALSSRDSALAVIEKIDEVCESTGPDGLESTRGPSTPLAPNGPK